MAIVNTKSSGLLSFDAQPRVIGGAYLSGASDIVSKAVVLAGATDSLGSTYRFGFLPSGACVQDIAIMNDATITGVWQLGVYMNSQQGLNLGSLLATWGGPGVAYAPGNIVLLNNVVYVCTTGNTNSQPPSVNWTTGGAQLVPPGAPPIPNAQQILAQAISTASPQSTWKSVYSPSIGALGATAGNSTLRVWELLGLLQDPDSLFHLVLTCTNAPSASGNIALQWSYTK
jgi:hypothetical protein